jgi:hypothetical protein
MTDRVYRQRRPRKYQYSSQMMTRAEAEGIRVAHLQGTPVLALELQEACRVLAKRPEPHTLKLPLMTAVQRERINGVLLFNLRLAIGSHANYEHPRPTEGTLLRDFLTCETCRGLGFVRKAA